MQFKATLTIFFLAIILSACAGTSEGMAQTSALSDFRIEIDNQLSIQEIFASDDQTTSTQANVIINELLASSDDYLDQVFSTIGFHNNFYLDCLVVIVPDYEAQGILQMTGVREEWIPIAGEPKRYYVFKILE